METRKGLFTRLQQDFLLCQGLKPEVVQTSQSLGLGAIESTFANGIFPKHTIQKF
ncbi:MAG TPA: hypothetical protein VKB19_18385 [Pedobacter sp.]|nr:hypothetical protein [Pedobacter sp.]